MRTLFLLAISIPLLADEPKDLQRQLTTIKQIYVNKLTGGEAAAQIRDMLMSSLQSTKLWVITENADKADAFLRNSADDLIFTKLHESHNRLETRGSFATHKSDYTSNSTHRNRSDRASNVGVEQNESSRFQERRHEALAAIRLVNRNKDLIWSTTKESLGAKFRGSAADVADKVVKQLIADMEAIRNPQSQLNSNRLPR